MQDECSWKCVQGSRGIPETFAEKREDAAFCPTEEK